MTGRKLEDRKQCHMSLLPAPKKTCGVTNANSFSFGYTKSTDRENRGFKTWGNVYVLFYPKFPPLLQSEDSISCLQAPPLVPILSHVIQAHPLTACFLKIYSNTLPSMSIYPKWFFLSGFLTRHFVSMACIRALSNNLQHVLGSSVTQLDYDHKPTPDPNDSFIYSLNCLILLEEWSYVNVTSTSDVKEITSLADTCLWRSSEIYCHVSATQKSWLQHLRWDVGGSA